MLELEHSRLKAVLYFFNYDATKKFKPNRGSAKKVYNNQGGFSFIGRESVKKKKENLKPAPGYWPAPDRQAVTIRRIAAKVEKFFYKIC